MPKKPISKGFIRSPVQTKVFKRITGKEYKKNDSSIYTILLTTGDEDKALVLSLKTLISSIKKSDVKKPSNYCPASTLHELVGKVVKHRK